MRIEGSTVLVTGAGGGIGSALCEAFRSAGAAQIAAADVDGAAAERTADKVDGMALQVDVGVEADIIAMVERIHAELGPVDIACSNAGVGYGDGAEGLASSSNEAWDRCWRVNVMAHVYLARALLPGMLERGSGHLVQVASAAGLLSQIGDAAYSATKHAAVAFAESLAITHGDDGVGVSLVCPQYVATPLLDKLPQGVIDAVGHVISPEELATVVIEGVAADRFLVLPHGEVTDYLRAKAADYDRWISSMRGLRRRTGG